ncbi:gem-associated protein 6 [Chanos chanos]|uniref:Gem-associated protein 6 n=1 Tax=Chanos chanos TaxID=29144 RepID=A0A6J2V6X8_CHACN|nr:gem-associated protein 6 [Chanos chanos]
MQDWCKKRPHEWHKYINQEVRVTAHDKNEYQGWVFTVDPVSGSVVLVTLHGQQSTSVRVVMGHAVRDVEVLKEGDEEIAQQLNALFMPAGSQVLTNDELKRRKEDLRLWLEKNRIPVTEEEDTLRVANVLTVSPPYGSGDCSSSNEIILARVQSLIESYPGPDKEQ